MNYKPLVTAALLTLTACSGSATSSPSTDATVTTTIAPTTTPTSTSTVAPTTTSSTTTVPATTAPPPTVDLTHPAETDTATWTLIINALYARAAQMLNDPVNTDPSIYTQPGSSAFEQITSSRQRLLDSGQHFEGRQPGSVESIQSVQYVNEDHVTISFTTAPNEEIGRLIDSNGAEVDSGLTNFESEKLTWVLVPYDDPTLPWRVSQELG